MAKDPRIFILSETTDGVMSLYVGTSFENLSYVALSNKTLYIRHTDIRGLPGEDGVSGRAIPTGGAGSFPALPAPGITGQMGRTL